jgi:hypothetical protein
MGLSPLAQPPDHPTEYILDAGRAAFELGDLKLSPGQKLLLGVNAADLCSLGKRPNIGAGERWLLDVVTPEQLLIMLKARELVLRQQFEAIIQETTETRDLLARMDFSGGANSAGPGGDTGGKYLNEPGGEPGDEPEQNRQINSPERRLALHLLRVERALTNCRKTAQETLGLADSFDDIRLQLVNNRIDTEELRQRLQSGIADPLRNIAGEMLPELERRLDALQSGLEDAKIGLAARDIAKNQADAVLLAMRRVLDRMIELQDYNEMVEMLRDIIKQQELLQQQTERRHKQTIRDLLKE